MKKRRQHFLTLDKFGSAIGLGPLEKEVVHQKNRIIDYLKKERTKRGLSQAELAKKVGTQQPAIARFRFARPEDDQRFPVSAHPLAEPSPGAPERNDLQRDRPLQSARCDQQRNLPALRRVPRHPAPLL